MILLHAMANQAIMKVAQRSMMNVYSGKVELVTARILDR
jgi:hypothetical protein